MEGMKQMDQYEPNLNLAQFLTKFTNATHKESITKVFWKTVIYDWCVPYILNKISTYARCRNRAKAGHVQSNVCERNSYNFWQWKKILNNGNKNLLRAPKNKKMVFALKSECQEAFPDFSRSWKSIREVLRLDIIG